MSTEGTSASSGLFLDGDREYGDDVRIGNVNAVLGVANIIKSSLGPTGLDKLLVDDIGDVTITNDGATILSQLDVQHPACKLLIELSQLQDREIGDGTTSVVLIAAELLRRAYELQKYHSIHPTRIISGYRTALKKAISYAKQNLIIRVDDHDHDDHDEISGNNNNKNQNNDSGGGGGTKKANDDDDDFLIQAAKTSMSSKFIGTQDADFFAKIAVEAVRSVGVIHDNDANDDDDNNNNNHNKDSKKNNSSKKKQQQQMRYPLSSIQILKAHGKSVMDSEVLTGGFALAASKASQAMPSIIEPTLIETDGGNSSTPPRKVIKICMLDMNIQRHRMNMGITVQVKDPNEINKIYNNEIEITRRKVMAILNSGAQIILTTKGIDDICLKYFIEAGKKKQMESDGGGSSSRPILCVRRCNRDDLRRLAKATGGTLITTMANIDDDDDDDEITDDEITDDNHNHNVVNTTMKLDPTCLGRCYGPVREIRVGDGEVLYFDQCHGSSAIKQQQQQQQQQNQEVSNTTTTTTTDDDDTTITATNGNSKTTTTTSTSRTTSSTIILRGSNEYMLDEMDRALHDTMSIIKRLLETSTLVAGGGSIETALSVYLEQYASQTVNTVEQYAIQEYAESLLVIPKTLAMNAAYDATEVIARLRNIHAKCIHLCGNNNQDDNDHDDKKNNNNNNNNNDIRQRYKYYGLNLLAEQQQQQIIINDDDNNNDDDDDDDDILDDDDDDILDDDEDIIIGDNMKAGVIEPAISKIKSLRFATEAAITILRIDDRITVHERKK